MSAHSHRAGTRRALMHLDGGEPLCDHPATARGAASQYGFEERETTGIQKGKDMRLTNITLGLTLATLVATAAAAQKITTESSPGTSFASYRTYTWLKQPNVGDPLLKQRIMDDISAQLQAKGLQPAQGGADLAVAAHMATKTEKTLNTFYDGFGGGWRWGGGFGSATTTVNTYQEGTLVVDLFDAKTKQAVWRGTATQGVSSNPQTQAKNIDKAAQKIFGKFPPAERTADSKR
jgi:hypothetical protein